MAIAKAIEDRPKRRPAAMVAGAVGGGDTVALVEASREQDGEVGPAEVTVGVELAIAPRYQAPGAGGGWGDIAHLMDTVLRDRILFGTDWPMLRYERALQEIELLGLRPESRAAYLGGNARRLLGRLLNGADDSSDGG